MAKLAKQVKEAHGEHWKQHTHNIVLKDDPKKYNMHYMPDRLSEDEDDEDDEDSDIYDPKQKKRKLGDTSSLRRATKAAKTKIKIKSIATAKLAVHDKNDIKIKGEALTAVAKKGKSKSKSKSKKTAPRKKNSRNKNQRRKDAIAKGKKYSPKLEGQTSDESQTTAVGANAIKYHTHIAKVNEMANSLQSMMKATGDTGKAAAVVLSVTKRMKQSKFWDLDDYIAEELQNLKVSCSETPGFGLLLCARALLFLAVQKSYTSANEIMSEVQSSYTNLSDLKLWIDEMRAWIQIISIQRYT